MKLSKKMISKLEKLLVQEHLTSPEKAIRIIGLVKASIENETKKVSDKLDEGFTYSKVINGSNVGKVLKLKNVRNIITYSYYKSTFASYSEVVKSKNNKVIHDINEKIKKLHEVGSIDLSTTSKIVVIK